MNVKLGEMLLFPKTLYQKLTDKEAALWPGFIFVGLADIIFNIYMTGFKIFKVQERGTLLYNIALFAVLVIVVGALDVIFFSVPLFDLFKVFKKEDNVPDKPGNLVRLMKIYILSHLIIVPVEIVIYLAVGDGSRSLNMAAGIAVELLLLVLPFWAMAAVSKGVNIIYSFQPLFKRLVFLAVFIWSVILGYGLSYVVDRWVMALFKSG